MQSVRGPVRSTTIAVALVFGIFACGFARAEDKDIKVVQWADHFTYGLPNTILGFMWAGVGVGVRAHRHASSTAKPLGASIDSTGQQIVLHASAPQNFEQSLGAVHISQDAGGGINDFHEAGHGKQSGLLGPLYLPTVGLDFAVEGYHNHNLIESWADSQRDLGTTMVNSTPVSLRLELKDGAAGQQALLLTNFAWLERNSKVPLSGEEQDPKARNFAQTTYRYGNVGIGGYLLSKPSKDCVHCGAQGAPGVLEGSLLQREFLTQWTLIGNVLYLLTEGKTETGAVTIDLHHQRVDAKFLSQAVGYGLRLGSTDTVALDAVGSAKWGLGGIWNYGKTPAGGPSPGVQLTGGLEAKSRVHLLDAVQFYGFIGKEWGTGGYAKSTTGVGVEGPPLFSASTFTHEGEPKKPSVQPGDDLRDPKNGVNFGKPSAVRLGAEHSVSVESGPSPAGGPPVTQKIYMTIFHLGGRF